jgi:hypothetical protein
MKIRFLTYPFLLTALTMAGALVSSCGKNEEASPQGFNTELNLINVSPDVRPVYLYIGGQIQNNRTTYSFPNASGYFFLGSTTPPLQIRKSSGDLNQPIVATINDTLRSDMRYTLFITGLLGDSTLATIFLRDTASIPTIGYGKLRFVNASPRSQGFDIYANDTKAFANQPFKAVSKFIEMPAGNYTLKITPTGSTDVLTTLNNFQVQDGKLYTLYTRGIAGRTDTAAFGAAVILNSK